MGDRIIRAADKVLVGLHLIAWLSVVVVWVAAWKDGPAPSGPQFNFAKDFIGAVDYPVYCNADALAMRVAQRAAAWFSADFGVWYEVTLGGLLLVAGSVQWFLLGCLTQWIANRKGRKQALMFFCSLNAWIVGALLFWLVT